MKLSANQAAKEANVAKKTLLDAIKSGRLSASKNDKGHWEIHAVELFRVFPKTDLDQSSKPKPTPHENHQNLSENRVLEAELKAERMMRERLEAEIEDMKAQRDSWQMQAERQTLLLEGHTTKSKQGGFFSVFKKAIERFGLSQAHKVGND